MRSLLLALFFCLVAFTSFGTVVTIWSTGASGSYTSGNIAGLTTSTGSLTRNDNLIIVQSNRSGSTAAAVNKGWTVFDLSSIPAGSTITSVTVGWYDSIVTGSTSATTTHYIYGFPGDLSKFTNIQAINSTMETNIAANTANVLFSTTTATSFGTTGANMTASATTAFFTANVGGKVSLCFTMNAGSASNTQIHYIKGETGNTTSTTTVLHAPYVTITYTAPSTCSGTPATATASATPALGNSTSSHLLRLSGASTASNLTYQWQSSPTGTGSWTNITGATNPSWTVTGITAVTYYQCNVTCASTTTASTICSVGLLGTVPCTPTYTNPWFAYTYQGAAYPFGSMTAFPLVIRGGGGTSLIDSTLPSATGYADHTNDIYDQGLTLFKSNTYTVSVRCGGSNTPQNAQAWIDYDNNGTFVASESLGGVALPTAGTVFSFTTSAISSVATGYYRLRVRSDYSTPVSPSIDPCASYSYGDCRDYLIKITDPPPGATATPSSVAFTPAYGPITAGTTSAPLSTAINATFLLPATGSIVITAPSNFSVCSTAGGTYVSSYSISYTSATSASTVYVKFSPTAATAYSGNVTITGGGIASAVNIPVTGDGAAVCTGTPSAGTAVASPLSGNSTYNFTLTCSGYTSTGGLQFQWQSSPDSTSWSNITAGTTAVYTFTGISSSTYYRCTVTCSASTLFSYTPACFIQYFNPSSCTPTWNGTPGSYDVGTASNPFKVTGSSGSIIDNAAPSSGYVDNSASMICTLNTGASYTVTTGNAYGGPISNQVWIDFNNDGIFQTSESVGGVNINSTIPQFVITIPPASSGITAGYRRMRVEADQYYHAYPNLLPCPNGSSTANYNGEVRDYKVLINVAPYATITPASIAFPPTVPGSVSGTVNATVTASNLTPASGSLTVTAPTNFKVYNGSAWVSNYTISYTSGTLSATTIPIYFAPTGTGSFSGVNVTVTGGGITTQNVAVSGVGATVCSGTPTPGTVTASSAGGNSTTVFTLTCAGYSASGGIQFQWQSSPDSTTWSNVSGATLASYTYSGLSSNTYYRCNVTCSASSTTASTGALLVVYMTPSSCTPNWQYAPYYYTVGTASSPFKITGAVGSIVDNSNPSNGYADNTAIYGCTLNAGATYTVTVGNPGTTGFSYQIWLDFNNDGIFQSTETVGGVAATSAVAQTFNIVIPVGSASIRPGVYRMRVESEVSNHAYPNSLPCPNGSSTSNTQGEVRDYRITLNVNPTPISSPSSILFPPTTVGSSSPTVNVSFSAMYLTPATGNVTITAPTNFQVYNGTSWVSSFTIPYTLNTITTTTIPVQFNPTAVTTYSGTNVTIAGGGLTTINIAVSGAGANVCSGTPTAGTATISPTSGNASTTFTLTCAGYSAAGGIQFQWQSSADSSSWTSITGATLANYTFTGISANSYYRCVVTCSASSLSATANTNITRYFAPSSCTPSWNSPGSNNTYSIATAAAPFKLTGATGSINDANAANAFGLGYTDNTATMGCTLNAGTTYTCTTGSGTTGLSYQAWLDYNNDGIFQSTETIGGMTPSASTTQTFNILVPTGNTAIVPGIYRMRVEGLYIGSGASSYPNELPCPAGVAPYYYGDVRDYKITLNVPPYATVSPTSLTYSPTTIGTSSTPQTVSLSGFYLVPSSGSLTVTAPTGYAVSSTGSGYASSCTVAYTGGLCSSTIYVQFNPISAITYSGNVTVTGGGITTVNVAVTGTGASACSSTPAAGSAVSSPTTGNSGTTFTLSLSGASTLGGLTYQWQSCSTSGGTYANITGATNSTYVFSGLTATTYYKCVVTCTAGGSPATSAFCSATFVLPTATCTPVSGNPAISCTSVNMRFSSVAVTGESGTSIADATACNSTGYLNQTALSCTFFKSYSYNMTVTQGTSNACYTQFWIDFNSDGAFQSSESVGGSSTAFTGTRVITLNIPTNIPSGTFRMRGIMSWQSNTQIYPNIDPCLPSTYTYGEGRDYTVMIANPGPLCTATPTSLDFGTVLAGSTTSALSNSISAYFMTPTSGSLTVTAPSNYLICSTLGGTYVSSYTISYTPGTYTLGTLGSTTIYTKFVAPSSVGTYAGNITITGGGLSGVVIPVTGISANACTGTPAAGTASCTPSSGVSGTSFALSLSGASAGLSITYQWQYSITGVAGSYSNIFGATNPTYTTATTTTSTYFLCVVTCGNSGISSTSTPVFVPVWCLPAFATTSGCGMGVLVATTTGHFKLNGASGVINDSGACGSNYVNNYNTMSVTLNSGTAYTITTGGGGSIGYGLSEQIWIDFNNDGVFQTTESVGGIASYIATTVNPTGTITIPAGSAMIAPGTYRMRVEVILPGTGYPNMNPCPDGTSTYNYGEVRDYKVILNVPPIGSVSPTTMAFPITTTGTSSGTLSSTLSGLYLTPASGSLTITAPSRFDVFNGSSWVSSYTLAYTGGALSSTIQARFSPIASATSSGNITVTGGGLSTLNIAVSGTGAAACTGTPSPGTAAVSPGSGGATSSFTLTCSGFTAAGGMLFQWQSTLDTTAGWSDISGATSSVYTFTGISANTYFRCNVTCSTSSITATTGVSTAIFLPPSSCTPTCSNPSGACSSFGLYIASASNHLMLNGAIGSINDGGACTGTGYVDNSGTMSCTLSVGTAYTMTCGSGGFNSLAYQAWIDFNNDGIFQGSESVGGRTSVTTAAPTFTITIPNASSSVVVGGTYRLRVAGDFSNNYPSLPPCPTAGTTTYGEVRDYRITLNSTPTAILSPTSIAFPPTTVGTSSSPISTTLAASYLVPASGTVTVTAPAGFAVYNGSAWVSSYAISYTGATIVSSTIQVQFNPTAVSAYSGNVTITGGGLATTNLAVTGNGAPLCSGTPTAGTANVSVSLAGTTTPITLTCTGYTVLGGIQFQWQSTSDTTTSWTDISGATLASYSFTGISSNTYYRCNVTCSTSSITVPTYSALIRYMSASSCSPSFVNYGCTYGMVVATPTNHFILNGASGSINDGNTCTSALHYRDFTSSLGCTLNAGGTYTATCGNGGGNAVSYQIWIDFNNDGTFQTSESVGGNAGTGTGVAVMTCPMTIPSATTAGIVPGLYRMRVVCYFYSYGTYPSLPPCPNGVAPNYYGEVRDYAITLNVPPFATASPTSLSFPTTTIGTSSSAMTSTITGSYLTPTAGSLTITAPTGYTVFNGSSYVNSYTISYTAGTLISATVSVKFNPSAATTYTGNVTITGGGITTTNIAVTGTGSTSCTGTPTAGTAICSPSTGASSTVFNIGLTGTTVAGGLTYQWQSCATSTGSYTPISGATNTTYSFSGLSATTFYNCVVTCSGSGLSSTAAYDTAIYVFPAASCTPAPSTPTCIYGIAMTSYTVNGALSTSISDAAACLGTGYQDRTSLQCSLYKSYSYTTTVGYSSGNAGVVQFWIDFNSDGIFQSTETVGGTTSSFTTNTNVTLTIPSGVPSGIFRMRSVLTLNGSGTYPTMNPCMTGYTYGEARDYKVNIIDAPPLVTASPTTIAFGGVTTGTSAPPQSFAIVGSFLTPASGTLTVTAPANFLVCSTLGGTYVNSYTIAYTGGAISSTNVYVTFNPSSAIFYGGTVQITGGGLASAVNVTVNGTGASVCSGTPTAGTTVVTPTTGTVSTPFTLSLSGATVAGGMTYQWQSSSTGYSGSYTNITGATNPTYNFTGIRSNMYYQCIVTCPSFTASTSTVATATFVLPTPCSTPFTYASSACGSGMAVTIQGYFISGYLGSFNDVLACDNTGYRDRTALPAVTFVTGNSYGLTLSTTTVSGYSVNGQVWIDFNGDGVFQTTESVGGANNMTGPSNSITLSMPAGAGTGMVRMRAMVVYGAGVSYPSLNPCGGYNYGEVRDYTVMIVQPVPCSGTPAPGPLTSSATSGCNPVASLFSMPDIAGITGLGYQWQSSATGGAGSYSNISGATNYTYNSSSTANTYYKCSVTCLSSSGNAASGSQLISVTPSPGAITGTTAICVSSSTTLSNSLGGGTWSSSATSIATVHPTTGQVTGVSAGSCTISYTTSGCSPATSSFTVNSSPAAITGFTSLCVGGSSSLADATSGGTWSSANTAVATVVPSTGLVTAVATGTTTITYSNGCGSPATRSWTTNVSPVAITGPGSICVSSTGTLSDSVTGGTWTNSPTTVGTIDGSTGLFTATATTGTSVITYTIGFCSIMSTVTVGNTGPGPITGSSTVCANNTIALTDTTTGGSWSSSNTSIATVNTSGVVTGITSGSVTITYGTGCSTPATQGVTVNGAPVSISAATICSQSTLSLNATAGAGSYVYSWSGPRSFTSAAQNPTISNASTSRSGIYSVTATQSGCVTSRSYWVSVDSTPQVNVSASPAFICPGGSSTLADVVTSPLAGSNNYAVYAIPYAPLTLTSTTAGPSGDNVNSTATIPFSFNFYGTSYSSVNISTNGYINFGTASTTFTAATLPSAVAPLAMIAPFWHNLNAAAGSIVYTTLGTAPNRSFVVKFNGVGEASGGGVNSGQIVLYETSNIIDMFISQSNTASTYLGVCGIQNASGSLAATVSGQNNVNYTINNSVAGTGWRFVRPTYNYAWSPATGLSSTTSSSPVSSGLTSSQTYTVTTIDANSGCTAGNTSSVPLNVYGFPAAYVMTPHSGCTSGTNIRLVGSETTASYQLFRGATAVGSPITGTGDTLSFPTVSTSGTYKIVATLIAGGCTSTTMSDSATVYVSPTAYTLTGGNGCSATGVTIGLSNSQTGATYQLYNGASAVGSPVSGTTGSSISFGLQTAVGTYSVTATGTGSCMTNMTGTSVISSSPVVHNVTGGNGCDSVGITIGVDTTQSGVSYQLYRGASTVGSPVAGGAGSAISFGLQSLAGTYSVVATGAASCQTNMAGSDVISHSPVAFSVTGGNGCSSAGVTIGLSGSQTGVLYQLLRSGSPDGIPVAGTASSISFGSHTAAGTYTVMASGSGGCTWAMTGSSVISTSPVAFNVTGGGSFCGVYSIHVGIDSSEATASYQLYRGGTSIGSAVTGTGSAMDFGTFSTVGTYSVVATGAGSCQTNMTGTAAVADYTVGITLGPNPSVCQPASSASLTYSGAVGSPTTYSITWGSSAATAGFSDVSGGSLGSTISLVIPSGAHGVFTGTVSVSNGVCVSADYSFTLTVYEHPNASITSAAVPCMGYATSVTFTGVSGATVSYNVDGGSPVTGTLTGGTFTFGTGALTSSHTYELLTAYNAVCSTTIDTTITINPTQMKWVGGASGAETDWNTDANWACGFVPGATDDAIIPAGTTYSPAITGSGTATTRNLTLEAGTTLNMNSGSTVNVKGTLQNNGSIKGAGTLSLNGTSAQLVKGLGTVSNLELNNTAGASIDTVSRMIIKNVITITAGTFNSNDSLVIGSDSTATARVAPITTVGAGISGNVRVKQYMLGGRRAYRFMSHPFSSSIALRQWGSGIDVTGTGGAANGFTTTGSNAASAFWYHTAVGNSGLSYDPGWMAFTSANGTPDSNMVHRFQGIRIFCRGALTEGLSYTTGYTPSPTTITTYGPLNQGAVTVPLVKGSGANEEYNLLGNPYASPVDLGTVAYNAKASGNVVGAGFYIWNPYAGTVGIFQAVPIGTTSATPYYMQANGAFEIRAAHNGDSLNFTENNKASTITTNLLKAAPEYVSLFIYEANYHLFDMLNVKFDDAATENEDNDYDATKPLGGDFNFYAISSDNKKMAIDGRPFVTDKVVPLGVTSNYTQEYIIKAEGVAVPQGGKVYLHDKMLKQYVLLQQGTEYRFSVTKDAASQGDNRFELSMNPSEVAALANIKGLEVTMTPNPANDDVKIAFTSGRTDKVSVRLLDLSGVSVYKTDLGAQQNGSMSISLGNLASGIYMVELTQGNQKVVQRLVKE